jgi:DNA-binding transcriptional MerR regulator
MKSDKKYLPVDIYTMFDISKSTLFRWEKEEDFPPLERGDNGERQYNQTHVEWIGNKKVARLTRQYKFAIKAEDLERMEEIQTLLTKYKVLYLQDETGLAELQYHRYSEETLREILKKATEYESGDPAFQAIIAAVYKQTVEGDE